MDSFFKRLIKFISEKNLKSLLGDLFFIAVIVYLLFFYIDYHTLLRKPTKDKPIAIKNASKIPTSQNNQSLPSKQKTSAPLPLDKFLALKEPTFYENKDSLCLNIESNIFFLPRQIAVNITKNKSDTIYLPTEYSECLKEGLIKFWVIEYDKKSLFPFRYYLEIETIIVKKELLDLVKSNKKTIQLTIDYLESIFPKMDSKSVTKVTVRESKTTNEHFVISNKFLLFGSKILELPTKKTSFNQLSIPETIPKNSPLRNSLLPIGNNYMTDLIAQLNEQKNILIVNDPQDLSVLNIDTAYFYKFKKRLNVFYNTKEVDSLENTFKKARMHDLYAKYNHRKIIDLRTTYNSLYFHIPTEDKISAFIPGVRSFNLIRNLLQENSEVKGKIKDIYTKNIKDNYDNLATHYTILVGSSIKDPLVELYLESIPTELKNNIMVFSEGYYYLILYSYFYNYKAAIFEPQKVNINYDTEGTFRNHLLFGY